MLTIVTALPWEASRFAGRLRGRRHTEAGEGWAVWGSRGAVEVRVIVSGPGAERAALAATQLAQMSPPATGILATGVAAGLSPALAAGELVLAERVRHLRRDGGSAGPPLRAEREFSRFVESALSQAGIAVRTGETITVDGPVLTAAEKRQRHRDTRALVAQMEDHTWALAAEEMHVPFASIRAVLDPTQATLPAQVVTWDWRRPGAVEVTRALVRRPTLSYSLLRLARQRRAAVRSIDGALEALVAAAGG